MRVPIVIPDFQLGNEPLRLGEWSVEIGDTVEEGECVAELICPGLAVDLPAPAAGVIVELLRQPEQFVHAAEIVGWIEVQSLDG